MQPLDLIVGAFLGFVVIGGVSLVLSVRRGRVLCDELVKRIPSRYEELGRPYPGLFNSPRRSAYMRFVMQSEFTALDDPQLVEQFEDLRRREFRQLIFLLAGFGLLGAVAVWFEFFRAA